MAKLLAGRGIPAVLSYAGRVEKPKPQPVAVRVGGFGGAEGLAHWMRDNDVTHLVDATHPFAATISVNALAAAALAGVPHIALTRPAWTPVAGDRWRHVADVAGAVAALEGPARRVMLATGRTDVEAFAAQPQHHFLLRFVDAADVPPPLPNHHIIVDRGPFTADADRHLMQAHRIDVVVSKNAGGRGAEAKLTAARALGLPVIMINRPRPLDRIEVFRPEEVLRWLHHGTDLGV